MVTTVKSVLQRATPESQGIASSAVLQFIEAVESHVQEFHSFMLLRHGKVVAEGWWSPYRRDLPHMLFSLSKSFTSTAIGLAVAEGLLSLDDPVLSFFPDEAPAEPNEHLAAMQVRHLLSMSTGQVDDTMPVMTDRADGQWTNAFFEVPVVHPPGTHFLYNTGATYMLSVILQKKTGVKLVDYLQPRLFEPLGIEGATWEESPQGYSTGGFGLSIKTEDAARFGQLYLQKGMWEGKRLLPEGWVEEATRSHIANGDHVGDWQQGYGFQFWRSQHNAYRGDGAFGQYCVVMPEQDAVLAILGGTSDMQVPLDLVWKHLLPAMGHDALPEDAAAQQALSEKLASLNIAPVTGEKSSPAIASVSDRGYIAAANDLHIETLHFSFNDSGCTLSVKTNRGEQITPIGYGEWQKGKTTLFNAPWEAEPAAIVSSGAWTADDTFTTVVRLIETPFFFNIVYRFGEDRLTVESKVNVGFIPPETQTLIAHRA